jgi:hypothetical protein
MSEFSGFVALGDTFTDFLAVRDSNRQPVAPDAAPTFRVYGPSGILSAAGGTCTPAHTGSVTGASNASPVVITSASHGLQTGQRVTVSGVGGNTAANGTFVVTRVDANTFSLDGSTGNGAYTSGGTWLVTGFYKAAVVATGGNGFDAGEQYGVHYSWAVSSASRGEVHGISVT